MIALSVDNFTSHQCPNMWTNSYVLQNCKFSPSCLGHLFSFKCVCIRSEHAVGFYGRYQNGKLQNVLICVFLMPMNSQIIRYIFVMPSSKIGKNSNYLSSILFWWVCEIVFNNRFGKWIGFSCSSTLAMAWLFGCFPYANYWTHSQTRKNFTPNITAEFTRSLDQQYQLPGKCCRIKKISLTIDLDRMLCDYCLLEHHESMSHCSL